MNECAYCRFQTECFNKMDVLVEVKDMSKIDNLKKYGEITYISKYLNFIGLTGVKCMNEIYQDRNVIEVEPRVEEEFYQK